MTFRSAIAAQDLCPPALPDELAAFLGTVDYMKAAESAAAVLTESFWRGRTESEDHDA